MSPSRNTADSKVNEKTHKVNVSSRLRAEGMPDSIISAGKPPRRDYFEIVRMPLISDPILIRLRVETGFDTSRQGEARGIRWVKLQKYSEQFDPSRFPFTHTVVTQKRSDGKTNNSDNHQSGSQSNS